MYFLKIITNLLLIFNINGYSDVEYKFKQFISKYNKLYSNEKEYIYRYNIFQKNLNKIQEHNIYNNWKMDINEYTDLTQREFKKKFNFKLIDNTNKYLLNHQKIYSSNTPNEIDWVKEGAVTPIKNQGQCGSCWSFATTGSIEGAYFIKNGKLLNLSEQQLVDCSGPFGNYGCNGGLYDYAYNYVKQYGLCLESQYPYKAKTNRCRRIKCNIATKISSFVDVAQNDENALLVAVSMTPVAIAIEADESVFQFYSNGVMDSLSCGKNLDHAVLVVGYGELNGKKYWKVKNSWGTSWGMNGYILLGRNVNGSDTSGICGLATMPSYPVL